MNKEQKQVQQAFLDSEKQTIKELKETYQQALKDCEEKISILSARADMNPDNLQSVIYQKQYQQALKGQLEGVIEQLHSNEYATVSDYLTRCYQDGYIGTMYDIAGQGIPLVIPIDPEQVAKAIQIDSKLKEDLYTSLGEDVKQLKKAVRSEVSRGIANGSTWNQVASELAKHMSNTPFNKAYNSAIRIARTEGHRVQIQSAMDAQEKAKSKGADVVKQWDATLDGKTRDTHRQLDGQIRELDEPFEVGGREVDAPGMFGDPAEDCNCRCALLQRARWALGEDELQTLQYRADYFGLDKTKDFEDFKEKYLSGSQMADIKFKYEKPISKLNAEGKVVAESFSGLPTKVQKELSDVTFSIGSNGSACDTEKGIIYVAQGAEKQDVDHEFGHLIETRMISKESVKTYKDYLVEGLTGVDIKQEIYYNNANEPFTIFVVKGERFVSEYQGRIYVSSVGEALNPDGSINTDLMLETISEPFRLYQNDKDKLDGHDMITELIEGAVQ